MKKLLTLALLAAIALAGCGKYDDTGVRRDIDSLKDRVTNLEDAVEALQTHLETGSLITSVTPLPDDAGYRIEFAGGSGRAAESIEILHGNHGNHGKDGVDGKDGDSYIRGIADNKDGTITITLNDAGKTEYVFERASTAVRFETITASAADIAGGDTGTITFRVNPSNAWIPTTDDGGLDKWMLDVTDSYYITRADISYVTPSENFELVRIIPDTDEHGNIKRGQYVATIKCIASDMSKAFNLALVLNTTNDADPALVSSPVFSFYTGPDIEYLGTWITYYNDMPWSKATIDGGEFVFLTSDGDGVTIEDLRWEAITNPTGALVDDYPTGYRLTGTLTANENCDIYKTDGSGDHADIGDEVAVWWYISTDGKSLAWGNWFSPDHEADWIPFEKTSDPDPQYFGEWTWDNSAMVPGSLTKVTITDDTFTEIDDSDEGFTLENVLWTELVNTDADTAGEYPTGYRLTGVLTDLSAGKQIKRVDGSDWAEVGDMVAVWFYLSTDSRWLSTGDEVSADGAILYEAGYNRFIINDKAVIIGEAGSYMQSFGNYYEHQAGGPPSENVEVRLLSPDGDIEIRLDMLASPGKNRLEEGEYVLSDSYAPLTFSTYYDISFVRDQSGKLGMTGGTVNVSIEGTGNEAIYTIKVNCTLFGDGTVTGTYRNTLKSH